MFKKILIVLLVLFIGIQFYHAKPNKSTADEAYYIGKTYPVPEDVKSILAKACNDCHSNNTRYPWYAKVQPVDWWTNRHVQEGKRELNFDGFTDHSPRFQFNKMDALIEQVKENEMPLNSYLWIHKDAKLTSDEKLKLSNWAESVRDSLKAHYPMDSLIRRRPAGK
jgi:hypothetical protein